MVADKAARVCDCGMGGALCSGLIKDQAVRIYKVQAANQTEETTVDKEFIYSCLFL